MTTLIRTTTRSLAAAAAVLLLAACTGAPEEDAPPAATPTTGTTAGTAGPSEDVTIPADGLDLAGTLRLPDAEGPAPAVVLVHGSGPHSRDGLVPGQLGLVFSHPVPVYQELAEALQGHGYAVATWDKRTCGPFNGCAENDYPLPPEDLTFQTLADDVHAVLDLVTAREDIGDVVLVGHSKGGTIAAGVAAQRDDLAGLVLLASHAGSIVDVVDGQAEKLAELVAATGQQGGPADQAVAEIRDLVVELREVAAGGLEGPPLVGAPREFWAEYIDASLAAPGQVAALDMPVLALGGEYDWNVPPEQVLAWEQYLGEHGRVEILPRITHALNHLAHDDPTSIGLSDVGQRVDASVLTALTGWLGEVL